MTGSKREGPCGFAELPTSETTFIGLTGWSYGMRAVAVSRPRDPAVEVSNPVQVEPTLRTMLLLVSFSILTGCAGSGEPPPLDMSLLTGEPCEPPCWQGLTPGESTEEDVAEFVRTTRFVDTRTIYRGSLTRRGEVVGVSIHWDSTAGGSNTLHIEGGVLKTIIISPDYDLTLQRVVERYGPPEKYRAILQGFERQWVDVILFYPTHGFTMYLALRPDHPTLDPESKVAEVWYFRAAPLERFMELGWEAGHLGTDPSEFPEFLRDWQGYGPIELE